MLPVDYVSSVEDEFRKVGNGRREQTSVSPTSNHAAGKVSTSLHLRSKYLTDVLFSGGSKGGRQGRAPPPWGSKFFHFHAVFSKKIRKIIGFWELAPPPGGKSWIRHCSLSLESIPVIITISNRLG